MAPFHLWFFVFAAVSAILHTIERDGGASCEFVRVREGKPVSITVSRAPNQPNQVATPVFIFPLFQHKELGLPLDYYGAIDDGSAKQLFKNGAFKEPAAEHITHMNGKLTGDEVKLLLMPKDSDLWCVYTGPGDADLHVHFVNSNGYLPLYAMVQLRVSTVKFFVFAGLLVAFVLTARRFNAPSLVTKSLVYGVLTPITVAEAIQFTWLWVQNAVADHGKLYFNDYVIMQLRGIIEVCQVAWLWLFASGYGTLHRQWSDSQKKKVRTLVVAMLVLDLLNMKFLHSPAVPSFLNPTSHDLAVPQWVVKAVEPVKMVAWAVVTAWTIYDYFETKSILVPPVVSEETRSAFRQSFTVVLVLPLLVQLLSWAFKLTLSYDFNWGERFKNIGGIEGLDHYVVYSLFVELLDDFVPYVWMYYVWVKPNRGLLTTGKSE
ncbi:hypothetical protein DICA4_F20934 [Diutina catenulata]